MFSSDATSSVMPFPGLRLPAGARAAARGDAGGQRRARLRAGRGAARDRAGEDQPRHLLQALRRPRGLLRPGPARRRRVALPPPDRRRPAPAELARGAAGGARRAARVLRQPAGDREGAAGRAARRGRARDGPAPRSDGAPLPRPRRRAPRDSLSPSSTSCYVLLHSRGDRLARVGEADGRRRGAGAGDAPRPALLRRHAVLRRERRLGGDVRRAARAVEREARAGGDMHARRRCRDVRAGCCRACASAGRRAWTAACAAP